MHGLRISIIHPISDTMELKIIVPVILAAINGLILMSSCTSSNSRQSIAAVNTEKDNPVFITDSVNVANTITVGNCSGLCTVCLEYPVNGKNMLVDSLRNWIDTQLNISGHSFSSALDAAKFAVTQQLDSINKDITDIITEYPDYKADYETQWKIGPVYSTEKVVTYYSNQYIYEGGAHGLTFYNAATFRTDNGTILGWNMFKPDSIPELTKLVKDAIIEQHFESAENFKAYNLLNDDKFVLPSVAPVMEKDGVSFTYQQYEIAAYVVGMPSCVIPYSTLMPYFVEGIDQLIVN